MSFNTKLFFDEELNKTLLEGGENANMGSSKRSRSGKSKKTKDKMQAVADEDQAGFIRKVYGLFSIQVLCQLVLVILVSQADKESGFRLFVKKLPVMIGGAVIAIIATALVIIKKTNKENIPTGMGYACWFLQTVGFSLVAGYLAARKANAQTVLVAEISTMAIAILCTFFGGALLKMAKSKDTLKTLGSTFLVLSLVLTTVLIASTALGIAGTSSKIILSVFLLLATVFFIVDTQFIVDGRYAPMTKDDYIFGSMKLFADFILIFTIIMQLFE